MTDSGWRLDLLMRLVAFELAPALPNAVSAHQVAGRLAQPLDMLRILGHG